MGLRPSVGLSRSVPAYLVVDDSRTIRLAMLAALRQAAPHAELVEASGDEEALRLFLERSFHVTFLDMVLRDEGTSLHLLRQMLDARPEARVVVVTGLDREHPDVVAAVSHGAFAYLRKPIRVDDIRGVLATLDAEEGRGARIR